MILAIGIVGYTIYIKKENTSKQKQLEKNIEEINKKEEKIQQHKEKLSQYKTLTQQDEAQSSRIKELEALKEELTQELNSNIETLETLQKEQNY